jgi:hypothetical protein
MQKKDAFAPGYLRLMFVPSVIRSLQRWDQSSCLI